MAVDKNTRKDTYSPHKGKPTDTGKSKAETKEIHGSKTDLNYKEGIREDYEQGVDEPADRLKTNPNRNPNKT